MGDCSSRFLHDKSYADSGEIPQPVILKEDNFAFVHYTHAKISYSQIGEILLAIPDYIVSEISSYQILDSEKLVPAKNLVKVSLVDADSEEVRAGLLVEKFNNKTIVQLGSSKVIGLILGCEDARFLCSKKFTASDESLKCPEIIEILHGTSIHTIGGQDDRSRAINYIKTVLR